MVKKICELFDGRSADMIRDLTEQMTKASEAMEYERAAVLSSGGKLIYKKHIIGGVTVALAAAPYVCRL